MVVSEFTERLYLLCQDDGDSARGVDWCLSNFNYHIRSGDEAWVRATLRMLNVERMTATVMVSVLSVTLVGCAAAWSERDAYWLKVYSRLTELWGKTRAEVLLAKYRPNTY